MTGWVVAVAVIVVGAAVGVWIAKRVPHPEETASHRDVAPDTPSDRFHHPDDRPAGPDAEDPVGPYDLRNPDAPTKPPPPPD